MGDYETPWDDLPPRLQEQFLAMNRVLFEDPDWTPPPGYAVPGITLPAETWDGLFGDEVPW